MSKNGDFSWLPRLVQPIIDQRPSVGKSRGVHLIKSGHTSLIRVSLMDLYISVESSIFLGFGDGSIHIKFPFAG